MPPLRKHKKHSMMDKRQSTVKRLKGDNSNQQYQCSEQLSPVVKSKKKSQYGLHGVYLQSLRKLL